MKLLEQPELTECMLSANCVIECHTCLLFNLFLAAYFHLISVKLLRFGILSFFACVLCDKINKYEMGAVTV